MRFSPLDGGAGFQVGRIGSLIVTVHTQAATADMLRKLDAVLDKHRAQFPRFSVLALVTGTGIRPPEAGLRDLVVAQEKRFESAIIGAAVAIEAKGLPAVFTRTFLVAYTLLSSHKFELQSFGSTEQAVAWLQTIPGQEEYFRGDLGCALEAKRLLQPEKAA